MEELIEHWCRGTFETTTKVASTEPSKNNNQGNLDTSSTPLSRITTTTAKKPTTKKRSQNASSLEYLSHMSLDELRVAVFEAK